MSILSCLERLVKTGKISREVADDARAIHDSMLNGDLLRDMDAATADAYAGLKTAEAMENSAREKKLELARATKAFNDLSDRVAAHPNGQVAGFMAVYTRDLRNAGTDAAGRPLDRVNVESLAQDYQSRLKTMMHGVIDAYEPKMAGFKQNLDGIRNLIRENFGVDTGDAVAKAASDGWKKATGWAEDRARNLGKVFDAADNWRQPQHWDSGRVNSIGAKEFQADVMEHVGSGGVQLFDKEAGRFAKSADDSTLR